jgi:hypothetical protein
MLRNDHFVAGATMGPGSIPDPASFRPGSWPGAGLSAAIAPAATVGLTVSKQKTKSNHSIIIMKKRIMLAVLALAALAAMGSSAAKSDNAPVKATEDRCASCPCCASCPTGH